MTSPDKERGLRLTWQITASGGLAWAYVGPLYLEVDIDGDWFMQGGSRGPQRGKAIDLVSAQLAAETAAVDLLCASLAAFADGAPANVLIGHSGGPWRTVAECASNNHEGARRLAISLLAASASTKEPTPT